ncbi:hypothetical protein BJV82DRAFT_584431 [Fennellomyces sp. T-0311]|nr:hypothetical protein BJV82DRAFT_584431 [Fennellomyces sp. T-0311]
MNTEANKNISNGKTKKIQPKKASGAAIKKRRSPVRRYFDAFFAERKRRFPDFYVDDATKEIDKALFKNKKLRKRAMVNEDIKNEVLELYNPTMNTYSTVAEVVGISSAAVSNIISEHILGWMSEQASGERMTLDGDNISVNGI